MHTAASSPNSAVFVHHMMTSWEATTDRLLIDIVIKVSRAGHMAWASTIRIALEGHGMK